MTIDIPMPVIWFLLGLLVGVVGSAIYHVLPGGD
jgi:hypothetical protein